MNVKHCPRDNFRIIIIDDNESIHNDIRAALEIHDHTDTCNILEENLFENNKGSIEIRYEIDSAYQGIDGYKKVAQSKQEGKPYSIAFVDMRMPPGWNGEETILRLWEADPNIEIVVCTAFADQSWSDLTKNLHQSDKFIIVKKPFDIIELKQLTKVLSAKWIMCQKLRNNINVFEKKFQSNIREIIDSEYYLKQVQKLDEISELAEGIADEINTPIQFIDDSIHFLKTAFTDLNRLIAAYRKRDKSIDKSCNDEVQEIEKTIEIDYLIEEIPKAFDETLDGVSRVASVVNSVEQFTISTNNTRSIDINDVLKKSLAVTRSEYKYVAEIIMEFDENLPLTNGRLNDLNQVFVNIIINAVHAIVEVNNSASHQGIIKITTKNDGDNIIISISDNGQGIPQDIQDHIFDHGFTTKNMTKNNWEGLSVDYKIISDTYGGDLYFETEIGKGSTFYICLPIDSSANNDYYDLKMAG